MSDEELEERQRENRERRLPWDTCAALLADVNQGQAVDEEKAANEKLRRKLDEKLAEAELNAKERRELEDRAAAAEARAACKPGSIRDRIITDHITLLTTTLRTSELARYKAIWNLVGGTLVFSVVFGLYVKWSTKTAERRLREAEIETFGEYRAASTIVADKDDDDDDDDDDEDDDDDDDDDDE